MSQAQEDEFDRLLKKQRAGTPAAPAAEGDEFDRVVSSLKPAPAPASTPAPDTGNVDLRDTTKYPVGPTVAPVPAPAPRRGIGARLGDMVESARTTLSPIVDSARKINEYMSRDLFAGDDSGGALPAVGNFAKPLTPEQQAAKTAAAPELAYEQRQSIRSASDERPQQTGSYAEQGTVDADVLNTPAARDEKAVTRARAQANFTPKVMLDLAQRGMKHAGELNAQAQALMETDPAEAQRLHQVAETFSRNAYVAQRAASSLDKTTDPVVRAAQAFLGALPGTEGPRAKAERTLGDVSRRGGAFTQPEVDELGRPIPVAAQRDRGLADSAPELIGSLVPFIAGDAAVSAGVKGLSLLTKGSKIGSMLEAAAEAVTISHIPEAAQLRGVAGIKQGLENLAENAPKLLARGAVVGQVPGLAIAGQEAATRGDDVGEAMVSSVLGNAVAGPLMEGGGSALGLGSLLKRGVTEMGEDAAKDLAVRAAQSGNPVAARLAYALAEERGAIPMDWKASRKAVADAAAGRPMEIPINITKALNAIREQRGQTPLGDQTVDGQRAAVAKAIGSTLAEAPDAIDGVTGSAPVGGSARDAMAGVTGSATVGGDATGRSFVGGSARDAMEGVTGSAPVGGSARDPLAPSTPRDEVNAVVQMQRARAEADAMDAQAQALHGEAQQAAVEENPPPPTTADELTDRAAQDAAAGDPVATALKDAINAHVDALAKVEDGGGAQQASLRDRITLARTLAALNDARKKYGLQTGIAVGALAAMQSDQLSDKEKSIVGLGSVMGATRHVNAHGGTAEGELIDIGRPRRTPEEISAKNNELRADPFLAQSRRSENESVTGSVFDKEKTGMYSRMVRSIESDDFGKTEAKDAGIWLTRLQKDPRFNQRELELTIQPWLERMAQDGEKVTRATILDHLEGSKVKMSVDVGQNNPNVQLDEMPYSLREEIEETDYRASGHESARDDQLEQVATEIGSIFGHENDRYKRAASKAMYDEVIGGNDSPSDIIDIMKEAMEKKWKEHGEADGIDEHAWEQLHHDMAWNEIKTDIKEAIWSHERYEAANERSRHLSEDADWMDWVSEDEKRAQQEGIHHEGTQEYSNSDAGGNYREVRMKLDSRFQDGGSYQEDHFGDDGENTVSHYRSRDYRLATVGAESEARAAMLTPEDKEMRARVAELSQEVRRLSDGEEARLRGEGITDRNEMRGMVTNDVWEKLSKIQGEQAELHDQIAKRDHEIARKVGPRSDRMQLTRVVHEYQSVYASSGESEGFRQKKPIAPEEEQALVDKANAADEAVITHDREVMGPLRDEHERATREYHAELRKEIASPERRAAFDEWTKNNYGEHGVVSEAGREPPVAWIERFLYDEYRDRPMAVGEGDPSEFPGSGTESRTEPPTTGWLRVEEPREKMLAVQNKLSDYKANGSKAVRDAQREARNNSYNPGVTNPDGPSYSVMADHGDAISLAIKQSIIDAVDDDMDRIAFASADDRIDRANMDRPAAEFVYEQQVPGTLRRIFKALGEPLVFEKMAMGDYELNSIKLTPELKAKIKKFGLPFLGVAALIPLASEEAQAQGTDGAGVSSSKLLGSMVAGAAIGALALEMARSSRIRRLVKANRAMARELRLDDLSGLPNQRAFLRAVDAVDRDPRMAWVVLDGDQFKNVNDQLGHKAGDKAIKHFGKVVMESTEKVKVPMLGYRNGGDEFPVAVTQEHAAALLKQIEDDSPWTQDGVTTKLTGAWGNTYAEADAQLNAIKEARRVADPSLRRGAGAILQDAAETDTRAGVGGRRAVGDETSRAYTSRSVEVPERRRVLDTDVQVVRHFEPDPAVVREFAVTGHTAPTMMELDPAHPESVQAFAQALEASKKGNPFGAAVYQYSPEEYAGMRLFLSESGKSGGALKGNDMVSLFSTEKGGRAVQRLRIAEGGRTLDAFDTVLPDIYAKNGMRVVSRLKWDDSQRPPDWNKATFAKFNGGEPDVVFMVHDPAFTGDRLAGTYASSYDEAVQLQQQAAVGANPHGGVVLHSNPIGPALRALRRYPSAVAIAALGETMRRDDNNPMIQKAGVGVIALGALNAIGSRRLFEGGDWLGSKLVEQLRKTPEGTKLVRAFNPEALLSKDVVDAIIEQERMVAKGRARGAEFSGKSKKLGPKGDRAVSDVIEGESWEDTSKFSAQQTTDVLTVAAELKAEYDRLTQEELAAGTLDPAQARDDYAGKRVYAYHEAQHALADVPGAASGSGRNAKITSHKSRTLDIPIREAEAKLAEAQATGNAAKITAAEDALDEAHAVQMSQRVELGEIRESSYRAGQSIERAHANVAAAKLFETLRQSPGAVHPDWELAISDFEAADQAYKSATTQADKDAAKALKDEATVRVSEVTRRFQQKDGDYKSLPNTPSMGKLAGAVVQRDIAHSLEGFGTPSTYSRALRAWKELKTVFNPGTHIGNIVSNVGALHVGDVPIWLQPLYLTKAMQDLKSYGEGTRALAEIGKLNSNSVTALGEGELGGGMASQQGLEELLPTTRPETQQVLRQNGIDEGSIAARTRRTRAKGMLAGAAIGGAKGYDPDHPENAAIGAAVGAGAGAVFGGRGAKFIRKFYDNEDNVARIAVFLRRRALGDTIEEATDRAVNSLGDFRSKSPALRALGKYPAPFIMYQAKAVPEFVRNVIDHPWKYLTMMSMWGYLNEKSKETVGEIPEHDIPLVDRQSFGYLFPGMTQLPFADAEGNKAATDLARWTPLSGFTTGAPPGSVPEAFGDNGMQLVTPGGPAIDAALQVSNIDPYSKGPLLRPDRSTSENVGKLLNKAADFALPSALGIHASRLKADYDNEDWTKFKNDLLGPLGVKPRFNRPGAVAVDAEFRLQRDLRDMKQELKQSLRANKNEDRVPELTGIYQRRVAKALVNFKQRIGVAPSPETVDEFLNPSAP
ncbi:MAG: diguanylate cyclase [bacterium]